MRPPGAVQPGVGQPAAAPPIPPPPRGPAARVAVGGDSAAAAGADVTVGDFIARSDNPILSAAGPLLSLGVAISSMSYQADVEALRARAVDAVRSFEEQ